MTKTERQSLVTAAATLKGRRTARYVDEEEVDTLRRLDRRSTLKGKTIRVYSSFGFVPNSYRYAAPIDYVERVYSEEGRKVFRVGQTDAKRSNGHGPHITVNNRAFTR